MALITGLFGRVQEFAVEGLHKAGMPGISDRTLPKNGERSS